MRQRRKPYREADEDEDAISDNLAAVNDRLDELTQQLERMTQSNAGKPASAGGAEAQIADRVTDALARLDRRLDQVIAEGRVVVQEPERRGRLAPPSPAPPPAPPAAAAPAPSRGPVNWAAQISARQRALDGGVASAANPAPVAPVAAQSAVAPTAWEPAADLTGVEQQLRQINSQISTLHQPYEDALGALRHDLAEVGRTLTEAMPRRAIEALEADVRALAERLDRTKQAGADGTALATLERGLDEVRDALRGLTPAENLVGFEDAVRGLSHKIDQLAASTQATQDPMAFKQLEQAVVSLRGIVSNVASDGALAQLSAEVHALGGQFERAAAESSTEALARLEARITALLESGRAMPPELEGSIRALSERLDRMQLSQGDQLALVALEDRIAKLSEKLDASDARLRHLDAIERGLADLLVYLEEMRSSGARSLRAPVATEPPAPSPSPQPPATDAAPASALDLIPGAPAPATPAAQMPAPLSPPPPQSAMATQVAAEVMPPPVPAKSMPRGQNRAPRAPDLAPDTPLEPGSGTPRVKPGSPAARIAASEAVLGNARPAAAESGGKSAALAAARNAAKAAYLGTPMNLPQTLRSQKGGWFKWLAKKPPKIAAAPPIQPAIEPPLPADDRVTDMPLSRGKKLLRFIKTLLIAASVAIIVVGAAQTAFELLWPEEPAAPNSSQEQKHPAAPAKPLRPMPAPEGSLPAAPGIEPSRTGQAPAPAGQAPGLSGQAPAPGPTGQVPGSSSFFDPATVVTPKPSHADVTGSIGRQPAPPRPPAAQSHQDASPASDSLPTAISPALRVAAAANNPAAEYEMGARYAEGRGVTQNMAEATLWFGRAADAGFAPAQFRLASLYEKGNGLKKDLQAARRLYLAAAGKGHAKAMHNLAVLYAEGIDGKPDYTVAAQWFRKAASHGVTDSQYNLAILYARGIGAPANLAESYKWFALAAASGDADAARKRDEVGSRLDQQNLTAARLAAQTFVPEREPEEATSLKAPPGGWDRMPAAPAKPRRRSPASTAQ